MSLPIPVPEKDDSDTLQIEYSLEKYLGNTSSHYVLQRAIVRILQRAGFGCIEKTSMDILLHMLETILMGMSRRMQESMVLCGRTKAVCPDVVASIKTLSDISLTDLLKFCHQNKERVIVRPSETDLASKVYPETTSLGPTSHERFPPEHTYKNTKTTGIRPDCHKFIGVALKAISRRQMEINLTKMALEGKIRNSGVANYDQ
ncbi:hypothetical protein ROZALSC1DRAFT_27042 [Rozella allomycis CSF55]|uniref:Bromodomain associated domain-containing protein n=1 Tax=Rozella allomycis (strain CSF55) TaxID=988480 RepID=A0A075B134_ROZAC|nr:hypothetical protein O9G_002969 [Rozella allomycis CSF55]RKP21555.1 hypothetical protein ROZALSC1DRAFT_27042 [Rozella allomycis CSF55]|eukprot:EPZ34651.1 hypothetical protein O9G_002969 [Rozella allomycis CSF55]